MLGLIAHVNRFFRSIGCYGFYLGFDTKEETSAKDGVCGFNADKQTCVLLADRGKLCRACHESGFDVMMILISFYMAFFGVVGMGTSCGFGTSLQGGRFGFMRNRMGRGFFLFFMGTLAVAQGANFLYTQSLTLGTLRVKLDTRKHMLDLSYLHCLGVGIVDCVVGFAMMFSYCFVKSGEAVVRVRNNGQQYQAIAG